MVEATFSSFFFSSGRAWRIQTQYPIDENLTVIWIERVPNYSWKSQSISVLLHDYTIWTVWASFHHTNSDSYYQNIFLRLSQSEHKRRRKQAKNKKKIEKTKRERLTKNKKRSELEVNEGIERESCAEHTHQWINQTKWRLIMKTQGKTDSDLDHPRSKIFRIVLAYRT